MQPSDFLTILGLALAVWSIIPSKERDFLLLFFSNCERFFFIVGLVLIHFLMAFDWLKDNWFPSLRIFTINHGTPAATVAYIIALFLIAYPVITVYTSFFAASKLPNLIALYKSLLKSDDVNLLASYLHKYHIQDIKTYLAKKSALSAKSGIEIVTGARTATDQAHEKIIQPKRMRFAIAVYNHVLREEQFIRGAANNYPELFATAITGMQTKQAANEDMVKLYIECLFEANNPSLVQELKILNGAVDSLKDRIEYNDLPILESLWLHSEVAHENSVWYTVGEGAIRSLKYDKTQHVFLSRMYDSDIEAELWNCKIWIATVYFNYMVRESIYRDGGSHMWLFYFRNFVRLIIGRIPPLDQEQSSREFPTFYHYVLDQLYDVMIDWLELAKELETNHRVIDVIKCLGDCLHTLCQASERQISQEFKVRQLTRLLDVYCDYAYYPENKACVTTREWMKKLFLHPKSVDFGRPETTPEYRELLSTAWEQFDKVPFQSQGNDAILTDFRKTVLQPLKISINEDEEDDGGEDDGDADQDDNIVA